jgi:putative phage-type endonuclease
MSQLIFDDGPLGELTPWIYDDAGNPISYGILDLTQCSRQEWLQARAFGLGGSDMGTVMGYKAYKSIAEVNATKGPLAEVVEYTAPQLRWGQLLEEPVAQFATETNYWRTVKFPYMMRSIEQPWLLGNLDYLITGNMHIRGELNDAHCGFQVGGIKLDAILEIKTTGITGRPNSIANGILPDTYYAQLLTYSLITGIRKYEVATLVGQKGLVVISGEVGANDLKAAKYAAEDWIQTQDWWFEGDNGFTNRDIEWAEKASNLFDLRT